MERHHQKLIGVIEKGKFHLFTYENENKGVEKRYLQKFSLFIYCLYLRNPFSSRSYQKRNSFSKYQNTSFRRITMKRKSVKDTVLRNVKPLVLNERERLQIELRIE